VENVATSNRLSSHTRSPRVAYVASFSFIDPEIGAKRDRYSQRRLSLARDVRTTCNCEPKFSMLDKRIGGASEEKL